MNLDLVKPLLIIILGALLVPLGNILGNAFCRPVNQRERFLALFLGVVGALLITQMPEAFNNPQANKTTYVIVGGYIYAIVSLAIFWRAWDAVPKEDDRTILLGFIREEVQGRLHKMEVQVDQQIPVRAESMETILAPQKQPPNSSQKPKNLVGVIVSKIKSNIQLVIGGQEQEILPGRKIVDIFNQEAAKELLILGAPGAGKTTALLTLALQLCWEAEKDIGKPIPVVFELSAWQAPEKIPDWIAMQLKAKYQLSEATCQKYLRGGQFVLLLDGLDELKKQKDACIAAINEFRSIRDYKAQQLVVCSRLKDYGEASQDGEPIQELHIAGEYRLLPLSDTEIYDYLQKHQLLHIGESIALDPDGFLELARQPLLLDLIRKAYQDRSLLIPPKVCQTEVEREEYQKACQERLLADYVQHQLEENHDHRGYDPRKTKHYLEWLAQNLKREKTTEFLLENMQPSWLEPNKQKGYRIAIGLIVTLIFGLISILIFGLDGVVMLMAGIKLGLNFGLAGTLDDIEPYEVFNLSLSNINPEKIYEDIVGGIAGIAMIISGVISALITMNIVGNIIGLVTGLIIGSIIGMMVGLVKGLQSNLRLRENPNEGIWKSGQNVLILTVLSFPFTVALLTLPNLAANRPVDLPSVLLISIGLSLFFGIRLGGGEPFIQHFVLRYFLIRAGHIPRDYVGFLKYAEERGLILQNGGSFRFYHDLLREHLAGNP